MALIPQLSIVTPADRLAMWTRFGAIAAEEGKSMNSYPLELSKAHRKAWLLGWSTARDNQDAWGS